MAQEHEAIHRKNQKSRTLLGAAFLTVSSSHRRNCNRYHRSRSRIGSPRSEPGADQTWCHLLSCR